MDKQDTQPGKIRFMRVVLVHLRRYLITGIVVTLPSVVTIWVLWNMFSFIDGLAKRFLFEPAAHIPGVGVVLFFSVIILVGVFATNIIGKRMISFGERIMTRIPFANRIYKAVQQISNAFIGSQRSIFSKVVIVEYPRKGLYSLGFVTSEAEGEVQYKTDREVVCVFVPTTPNPTSGVLIFAPREDVIQLDMTTEDGLKMVISGGVVTPSYLPPTPPNGSQEGVT
ncbi:MAG: DUF502 domain-containing protein [Candidatus Abyssubacteria bacterium]